MKSQRNGSSEKRRLMRSNVAVNPTRSRNSHSYILRRRQPNASPDAMSSHPFSQNAYSSSAPYGASGNRSPSLTDPLPRLPLRHHTMAHDQAWKVSMGNMPSGSGYATGNMANGRIGGMMASEGRWWEAFGTGGFEGEPSLMEGESRGSFVKLQRSVQW